MVCFGSFNSQRHKVDAEVRALKAQAERQAAEAVAQADLESAIEDYKEQLAKQDAKTAELRGEVIVIVKQPHHVII